LMHQLLNLIDPSLWQPLENCVKTGLLTLPTISRQPDAYWPAVALRLVKDERHAIRCKPNSFHHCLR